MPTPRQTELKDVRGYSAILHREARSLVRATLRDENASGNGGEPAAVFDSEAFKYRGSASRSASRWRRNSDPVPWSSFAEYEMLRTTSSAPVEWTGRTAGDQRHECRSEFAQTGWLAKRGRANAVHGGMGYSRRCRSAYLPPHRPLSHPEGSEESADPPRRAYLFGQRQAGRQDMSDVVSTSAVSTKYLDRLLACVRATRVGRRRGAIRLNFVETATSEIDVAHVLATRLPLSRTDIGATAGSATLAALGDAIAAVVG